jgi:hypothetical protein
MRFPAKHINRIWVLKKLGDANHVDRFAAQA